VRPDPVEIDAEAHEQVVERVAAIDVAKASGMVCTRVPHQAKPGQRSTKVWQVPATSNAILELAEQLVAQGIERVVVESTSDYWRPWFYLLEARGLQVWLVNARDVKHLPGRPKTDKLDAVWLAKLNERGMLRPSFVPPAQIRQLRDYTRLRSDLTAERARHVQRLEQAAGGRPDQAVDRGHRPHGVSARAMIEALIAGQRDPKVLAELARGRLRVRRAALVEALTGRFDDHHAELARILLDHIDALGGQIERLTSRIEELIAAIAAAHPPRVAPHPPADHQATPPPARARTSRRLSPHCRRWRAWTRSPASAPKPPRSSSPSSGWTWASSPPPPTWCRGPGCHPAPSSPAPSTAVAPPARATRT
jgi:transposase